MKLSINVDHIATIREARGGVEPDPVSAALIAELAGCDGVTIHLRSDRRHIKERDLEILKKVVKTRLNLEMAATEEMIEIAGRVRPEQVTLVPEREGERTTEGGLDLIKTFSNVKKAVEKLKDYNIEISMFIEPEQKQIRKAKEVGADIVELNTTKYTETKGDEQKKELTRIKKAAVFVYKLGLRVHAGHGLNCDNVRDISDIKEIEEASIGHSIVAKASIFGFERAVKEMVEIIR